MVVTIVPPSSTFLLPNPRDPRRDRITCGSLQVCPKEYSGSPREDDDDQTSRVSDPRAAPTMGIIGTNSVGDTQSVSPLFCRPQSPSPRTGDRLYTRTAMAMGLYRERKGSDGFEGGRFRGPWGL